MEKSQVAGVSCAFLVHSQAKMHDSPPKRDSEAGQKAKRKRTSPHDHAILEAAYQANSKPSKEERASLVSQVQLGEKEVQIWFQNRRQNDRRRSKPLQPHELIAHLANSPSTPLTPGPPQEQSLSPATKPTVRPDDGPATGTAVSPKPSAPAEPGVASSQSTAGSDAAPPAKPESAATEESTSAQTSPVARAATPSSGRKRSRGEMERPVSDGALRGSPRAEPVASREPLKRSSSVRLAMTADGAVKIKTNDELTPSPEKACPLPPGLTEEGKQRRLSRSVSMASMASDGPGSLKPARHAAGTFGRSRDHRKWEFFCDNNGADDALSVQAEAECTGSAVGAINIIRSSSFKGRGLGALSAAAPRSNANLSTVPKPGKGKLVRAKSSFARLGSQPKAAAAAAAATASSTSTATAKGDSRAPSHVRAPSDSDKENWAPGTTMSENPLRRTQASANRRPVLQENESLLFRDANPQSTSLSPGRERPGGQELDCIQGLLSLSQGQWR